VKILIFNLVSGATSLISNFRKFLVKIYFMKALLQIGPIF